MSFCIVSGGKAYHSRLAGFRAGASSSKALWVSCFGSQGLETGAAGVGPYVEIHLFLRLM